MYLNSNRTLQLMAGAILAIALMAGAQTPATPPPAAAAAPAATPADAPAAPAPLSTFVLTGPLQWLPQGPKKQGGLRTSTSL